jgi:hypothetical protein
LAFEAQGFSFEAQGFAFEAHGFSFEAHGLAFEAQGLVWVAAGTDSLLLGVFAAQGLEHPTTAPTLRSEAVAKVIK